MSVRPKGRFSIERRLDELEPRSTNYPVAATGRRDFSRRLGGGAASEKKRTTGSRAARRSRLDEATHRAATGGNATIANRRGVRTWRRPPTSARRRGREDEQESGSTCPPSRSSVSRSDQVRRGRDLRARSWRSRARLRQRVRYMRQWKVSVASKRSVAKPRARKLAGERDRVVDAIRDRARGPRLASYASRRTARIWPQAAAKRGSVRRAHPARAAENRAARNGSAGRSASP